MPTCENCSHEVLGREKHVRIREGDCDVYLDSYFMLTLYRSLPRNRNLSGLRPSREVQR